MTAGEVFGGKGHTLARERLRSTHIPPHLGRFLPARSPLPTPPAPDYLKFETLRRGRMFGRFHS